MLQEIMIQLNRVEPVMAELECLQRKLYLHHFVNVNSKIPSSRQAQNEQKCN